MNMNLYFVGNLAAVKEGLSLLSEDYGYVAYDLEDPRSTDDPHFDYVVRLESSSGSCIHVSKKGRNVCLRYDRTIHFFRALGLLLEKLKKSDADFCMEEIPQFDTNGAMFDVSQGNGVMRTQTVKDWLKRMAMMGLNMLMLYCEDSFTVEKQPYFGYMRSRYTAEDFRECDEFASIFGIEMIPCIQTLAHLTDVLKWPVYHDIKEDHETLLVGEDKTYEFIEDLIIAASEPFRTKRIHIGMDEAWNLGMGAYFKKNGYKHKFDIMNEHMERVLAIVRKHGLEPMFWSDMYFRAASEKGDYYDLSSNITQSLIDTVPKGAQLVYWDYYHDTEDAYRTFIRKHREFGSEPIFAGGIWTWIGFNANWGKTFKNTNPALMACKKEGVREVFATIWGDNGTESNVYSNLLGLQLFAEHGYAKTVEEEKLKDRFEFCTGCSYDDFVSIKYLDEVPGASYGNEEAFNPSKYLMWQDLLAGLFDYHIEGLPLGKHYDQLSRSFQQAEQRNGAYSFLFTYLAKVAKVLSIKSELGLAITKAYQNDDKDRLNHLMRETLPELLTQVKALRKIHKRQWFDIHKAFGWDIMDMRYGSLLIRIQSAMEQLDDYIKGRTECIEELDEKRLSFSGKKGLVRYANAYGRIVSASRIAPNA